jgi:hypothetical protein
MRHYSKGDREKLQEDHKILIYRGYGFESDINLAIYIEMKTPLI